MFPQFTAAFDAAVYYQSKGWHVLPLKPNDKRPIKDWDVLDKRQMTPDELVQYFKNSPSNNIGIICGSSGLLAIDIDDPTLYDTFIQKYPTGMVQRTRSGGYHLLYKYAGNDINNSVGKLREKVDVRNHRGYIVAAPSIIDGKHYEWIASEDPSPLPDNLFEVTDTKIELAQSDDWRLKFLNLLANGFTPGKHNEELRDAARYLARRGLNDETIIDTLSWLNNRDDTPQDQAQFAATVRSGINYERQRLSAKQGIQAGISDNPAVSLFAEPEDVIDEMLHKEERWLIDEWLPVGGIIMLAAPPEAYKTWLSIEVAVTVAFGKSSLPLFGQYENDGKIHRVGLIQQEDQRNSLFQRLNLVSTAKWLPAEPAEGLIEVDIPIGTWLHLISPIRSDARFELNTADVALLEKAIVEQELEVVIIDPVYALGGNLENFLADLAPKLIMLKKLREKYGTTFILVHHTKKGEAKGREGMWGSQLLNGAVEGMWIIDSDEKNNTLTITKRGKLYRGHLKRELKITIDDKENIYTSELVGIGPNGQNLEVQRYIQDHKDCSRAEIIDGSGIPRATVYAAVKLLVSKEWVADNHGKLEAIDEF